MEKKLPAGKKIIRDGVPLYTPRYLANHGMIKTTFPVDPNTLYKYITQYISRGILKADNFGKGSTPYYLVSQAAVDEYNATVK